MPATTRCVEIKELLAAKHKSSSLETEVLLCYPIIAALLRKA